MQIHGEFCLSRVVQQVLKADSRTASWAQKQEHRCPARQRSSRLAPSGHSIGLQLHRPGPLRQPRRRASSWWSRGRDGR